MNITWQQTILAALLITTLSSCTSKTTVRQTMQETKKDQICSIREGMTESQVSESVGKPDEVRIRGETGIGEEAYRWVYGIKSKGEFPTVGAVIFRTNRTVFMSYCPTRPGFGAPIVPFSESPQITPSGMRCTIDDVFGNPDRSNVPYIRVSIENTGKSEFRYTNDNQGIRFSVLLEVYDAEKRLILKEPIYAFHSPYSFDKANWPILAVPAGARHSEEISIWWQDENDGTLQPGTYYLRVAFPFEEKKFFGSNLAKWELKESLR